VKDQIGSRRAEVRGCFVFAKIRREVDERYQDRVSIS